MPIRLFWWGGGGGKSNFGDSISPLIVRELSGKDVVFRPAHQCELVATGSVIDSLIRKRWQREITFRKERIKVWGAGSFRPERIERHRKLDIFAVRGPLTRDAMQLDGATPLGDPGLLVDRFQPRVAKRFRWGIIPHLVDRNENLVREMHNETADSIIIDLADPDLMKIIRDIVSCDFIISSSLHGIITADTLGVPHLWMNISGNVFRADWKFQDYFLSVRPQAPPALAPVGNLRDVEDKAGLSERSAIERRQRGLEQSFKAMNL